MSITPITDTEYTLNNLDKLVVGKPVARGLPSEFEVGVQLKRWNDEWKANIALFYGKTADEALARAKAALSALGVRADEEAGEPCTRCEQPIRKRGKWLELNCRTGAWTDPDKTKVPEEESQGRFIFGPECVKGALAGREYRGPKKK